ncbi:hypothetical protein NXZ75_15440 [Lysinibacillus sphaericus]|uniref:hypothetical protein n=1 Tax=Lysinibacillus sphaericus TaxID=1421 RepID=UPI002161219D|nr:hypothetical protein [Lysinibacillus sphaericus]MCS1383603.1 hypothetical protein [Lysinibacillus sphaericus]
MRTHITNDIRDTTIGCMSTYIANQEKRLAEQERAIIELSSLIAKESEGGEQNV